MLQSNSVYPLCKPRVNSKYSNSVLMQYVKIYFQGGVCVLWGSGSHTDGIFRAVSKLEQRPTPITYETPNCLCSSIAPHQDTLLVANSRAGREELPLPLLTARSVGGKKAVILGQQSALLRS